jgi:hypothetical protein
MPQARVCERLWNGACSVAADKVSIVNVTADSFSGGGRYLDPAASQCRLIVMHAVQAAGAAPTPPPPVTRSLSWPAITSEAGHL